MKMFGKNSDEKKELTYQEELAERELMRNIYITQYELEQEKIRVENDYFSRVKPFM